MHRAFLALMISLVVGCGGSTGDDTDDLDDIGCGTPVEYTITATGHVVDGAGARLAGVNVRFEDRAWSPGNLDTAVTGADGSFTLVANGLTWLPRCYATALSYWVVAEDGAMYDEKAANQRIFNAIEEETFAFSLEQFPLTLQ